MLQTITVRRAVADDVDTLSTTLAESFQADPVMTWCYPDAAERAAILPRAFRVILDAAMPHGGVETAEEGAAGSIWIPPGAELDERLVEDLGAVSARYTELDGERLVEDLGAVSARYTERLRTVMGLLDEHHPPAPEHQYLFILGTRSAWQSRGLGSALLRSVLSGCDRDGVPAYLEATSERNRSLYERHGFEVVEVLRLPDGPPLWSMWRTPS
jgi:GNAT superfamily N-acetyltransferase